jgi:hypothetical protein
LVELSTFLFHFRLLGSPCLFQALGLNNCLPCLEPRAAPLAVFPQQGVYRGVLKRERVREREERKGKKPQQKQKVRARQKEKKDKLVLFSFSIPFRFVFLPLFFLLSCLSINLSIYLPTEHPTS